MTTTTTRPVCPPNPDAACICGDVLAHHRPAGVDSLPYEDAECVDGPGSFTLVGGDSTECPDLTECSICEVDLCTEHSPEFTSCAGGDGIHHWSCATDCWSCSFEAGQEARAERNSDR